MTTLKELIDIDFKCEVIIGDSLKCDQLRFLYDSARTFYDSPVKPKLFPQDEQGKPTEEYIKKELVPRLTAFRTVVYMHDVDCKKRKDIEEMEKLKALNPPPVEEKKEPEEPAEGEEEKKEEEKKEGEEEEEEDEETKAQRIKDELKKKQDEEDAKYGRYMIWEGIIHEQRYEEWRSAADKVDGLNPHVIEDIQDFVIKQSFKPDTEEGKKEVAEVLAKVAEERKLKLGSEKEEEKVVTKVEIRLDKYRPDKRVWNFFLEKDSKYFREKHKFRFVPEYCIPSARIDANPFGIYEDGRVEKMWDDIKALELQLKMHQEVQWNALVRYVFDILQDDANKEEQAAYQDEALLNAEANAAANPSPK